MCRQLIPNKALRLGVSCCGRQMGGQASGQSATSPSTLPATRDRQRRRTTHCSPICGAAFLLTGGSRSRHRRPPIQVSALARGSGEGSGEEPAEGSGVAARRASAPPPCVRPPPLPPALTCSLSPYRMQGLRRRQHDLSCGNSSQAQVCSCRRHGGGFLPVCSCFGALERLGPGTSLTRCPCILCCAAA